MGKKFLTLNVGATNVELAEYEVGGRGKLKLTNYGVAALQAPLDGGNAETILVPALMEIMREKGIRPGKVALSVSGQMVFPKFAAIPMAGGADKFQQSVRAEIEQTIPFPLDEMVCDHQVLGDTEAGDKSVMIVAAKVDQIESLSAAVRAAGFELQLVDVAPISLINAIRYVQQDDSSCVIALDIGAKTTSLVIAEGSKLYNRSIPVAGNAISKEIATALGCSPEEADQAKLERGYVSLGGVNEDEDEVADRISKVCRAVMTRLTAEISRSINFYRSQQQGSAPVKLFLTGGTALLPQIDEFFADALGVEVELFNPFQVIAAGRGVDAEALSVDAALLAPTVGLALHLAGVAFFAINLMPPSIVSERAEKAKIPFLIIGGICLVAALVLVGKVYEDRAVKIQAEVAALVDERTGLENMGRQVKSAEAEVLKAQSAADELRTLFERQPAALQRLEAVRSVLKSHMWIHSWEGDRLTVRYWTDRLQNSANGAVADGLKDRLSRLPGIDPASLQTVDMPMIGKTATEEGQVQQITLKFKFK